jgi:hypothetical protein
MKSFFFSPLALMASLLALYSASHSFAVLTPPEARRRGPFGGWGSSGSCCGTTGDRLSTGATSIDKILLFSPEPFMAPLLAAYSASHSFTVFADAGAPANASTSPMAASDAK